MRSNFLSKGEIMTFLYAGRVSMRIRNTDEGGEKDCHSCAGVGMGNGI